MPYIAPTMKQFTIPVAVAAALLVLGVPAARADRAADVYRAMGIRAADVLTGTILTGKLLPGANKQVVTVTTYFTGSRDRQDAVNVRLDVFERAGEALARVYGRDFGSVSGGPVGAGELQLIDLDLDGLQEIIVSYESFLDPLIEQRLAEVIVHERGGFRTAWSGPIEYDATRAARSVPVERRDRFRREIDFGKTMRTRGITLFLDKQMIAVAGERLEQPKVVQETFPLRPAESR